MPFTLSNFRLFQFSQVYIYAMALLGLNILTGYNGQISLGHGAFVGIGAYTTIILVADHDWNYLATIPIAFVLTFVVGARTSIEAENSWTGRSPSPPRRST